MNKKHHILITVIITIITYIVCPLIYSTPIFDYNLLVGNNTKAEISKQIEKDNLILNKKGK